MTAIQTTSLAQPRSIVSLRKICRPNGLSHAQNVILSYGCGALHATVQCIDDLREFPRRSLVRNAITDVRFADVISNLCEHAGQASTILFNDSAKKGGQESDVAFALRQERVAYVDGCCSKVGIAATTLKNRRLRNSLTHLDEHFADEATKLPNVGWCIDFGIPTRTEFKFPPGITPRFSRTYIWEEDVILHFDNEMSLASLRNECVAVLAAVFQE